MPRWTPLTIAGITIAATLGFAAGCLMLAIDTITDAREGRRHDRTLGPRPANTHGYA